MRVDGNDVFACHEVMSEALDHARSGKGPVLVEFLTYRQGPHSTADNPRIYRTEEYEKTELKKEPLMRFRSYLMSKNL
jgi:pyruvate dehydrogenase E1 component alpha subunit